MDNHTEPDSDTSAPSTEEAPPTPANEPINIADAKAKMAMDSADAQTRIQRGSLTAEVVQSLESKYTLAVNDGHELFYYDGGVYKPVRGGWVGDQVREFLERQKKGINAMTSSLIHEVDTILRTGKPKLLSSPPEGRICLKNQTIDTIRGGGRRHNPNWLSTVQFPIWFDAHVPCPAWDKFISEVFPADCVDLAWEIIGSTLVSDRIVQEAIWLGGSGANGKSTFIMATQGLLGAENTVNLPIKSTYNNNFAGAEVLGKMLMFDLDATVEQFEDAGLLKKIIGGDEIRAEKKYESSFCFRPHCVVILAGNRSPKSKDASFGYLRRMVIVPFGGKFDKPERQDAILARLLGESEKSGAFNKALAGLLRLRAAGRFSLPESVVEAIEDFREDADPVAQFFTLFIEEDPNGEVDKAELVATYNSWATELKKRRTNKIEMGMWIGRNQLHASSRRKSDNGPRFWAGIRFKSVFHPTEE